VTVGQHVVIHTLDGHALRGRVSLVAPDRVWLNYPAGVHVVYRAQIKRWENG
jgi:hypothetical protein